MNTKTGKYAGRSSAGHSSDDEGFSAQTILFVRLANALMPVSRQADNIELAAMNAKTFAMRAGSEGQVYRPITDFLIELARKSVNLVRDIEADALRSTHEAAQIARESVGLRRIYRAASLADASVRPQIESKGSRFVHQISGLREKTEERCRRLGNNIGQFDELVRGARAVIATSRIETARLSEESRIAFGNTIDRLEESIDAIEIATHDGRLLVKDLAQVQEQIRRRNVRALTVGNVV